tara:strand:+ start:534 stop:680 length:147 start_codon:yes stop_codon:yes gene_type:complete
MGNNRYYYKLKDGYDIGDTIVIGTRKFQIIDIEEFNNLMLIEEIIENG